MSELGRWRGNGVAIIQLTPSSRAEPIARAIVERVWLLMLTSVDVLTASAVSTPAIPAPRGGDQSISTSNIHAHIDVCTPVPPVWHGKLCASRDAKGLDVVGRDWTQASPSIPPCNAPICQIAVAKVLSTLRLKPYHLGGCPCLLLIVSAGTPVFASVAVRRDDNPYIASTSVRYELARPSPGRQGWAACARHRRLQVSENRSAVIHAPSRCASDPPSHPAPPPPQARPPAVSIRCLLTIRQSRQDPMMPPSLVHFLLVEEGGGELGAEAPPTSPPPPKRLQCLGCHRLGSESSRRIDPPHWHPHQQQAVSGARHYARRPKITGLRWHLGSPPLLGGHAGSRPAGGT
jgi:hypothetical protein